MKDIENEIYTSVAELLAQVGKNVVVIPHDYPDGDAMGSAIGLGEILKNSGHRVTIISPNDYPGFLKWFSSDLQVMVAEYQKKEAKKAIENADILFCVDFNEARRAGSLEKKIIHFDKIKVLIDHHPNPVPFCDYTISEPSYSSTAELIYDVINCLGMKRFITPYAAEALYTGIMTDTGSFSHNISNPNTFKVVSELMQFGLKTDKIQSNIYHNFSACRMELLGYCLHKKMEVFPEFRSAFISLTREELKQFNFEPGDTEGFVNYPLSIKNIVFSALFIEKEGFVKASFRSKGSFPANEFSRTHFGGGGHLNAAGGESKLPLTETLELFRQLLHQYQPQLIETVI